jgi:hypothetical protein
MVTLTGASGRVCSPCAWNRRCVGICCMGGTPIMAGTAMPRL